MRKQKRHKCGACGKTRYERFMRVTDKIHANRRDLVWECKDCEDEHLGYGYFASGTLRGYRKPGAGGLRGI